MFWFNNLHFTININIQYLVIYVLILAIEKLNKYIDQQSEKLQLSNNEIKPLKSLKRKIKKIEFDSNQQSTLDTFFN